MGEHTSKNLDYTKSNIYKNVISKLDAYARLLKHDFKYEKPSLWFLSGNIDNEVLAIFDTFARDSGYEVNIMTTHELKEQYEGKFQNSHVYECVLPENSSIVNVESYCKNRIIELSKENTSCNWVFVFGDNFRPTFISNFDKIKVHEVKTPEDILAWIRFWRNSIAYMELGDKCDSYENVIERVAVSVIQKYYYEPNNGGFLKIDNIDTIPNDCIAINIDCVRRNEELKFDETSNVQSNFDFVLNCAYNDEYTLSVIDLINHDENHVYEKSNEHTMYLIKKWGDDLLHLKMYDTMLVQPSIQDLFEWKHNGKPIMHQVNRYYKDRTSTDYENLYTFELIQRFIDGEFKNAVTLIDNVVY